MKRRKPGKALEKLTREIRNADDFLEHIGGIADLYRREHALDATPRGKMLRQSLKKFRKHAGGLIEWLEQSDKGNPATPEHDAIGRIGAVLYGTAHRAHTASGNVAQWLEQADAAAATCLDDPALFPTRPQRNAPVIAGEALRATFEHHKLKFSLQTSAGKQGDAIRLLCAIAKNSGDTELTPADAKLALQKSGAPRIKTAK